MAGKTFFELCNEVLEELYYEKVDTFEELDNITEGRRVKRMLNQALEYICNNENEAWQFRNKTTELVLVSGMNVYDRPNGFIEYMKYTDEDIVLQYIDNYKYLPNQNDGLPVLYYISDDKLNLFPCPTEADENRTIRIEYYTNNFAEDCNGVGKCKMTCGCDVPIIPPRHRDILVWKVCADWRANDRDGHYEHYEAKFKRAYRALLKDCRRTLDKPMGIRIDECNPSIVQALYGAWQIRTQTSRGNM